MTGDGSQNGPGIGQLSSPPEVSLPPLQLSPSPRRRVTFDAARCESRSIPRCRKTGVAVACSRRLREDGDEEAGRIFATATPERACGSSGKLFLRLRTLLYLLSLPLRRFPLPLHGVVVSSVVPVCDCPVANSRSVCCDYPLSSTTAPIYSDGRRGH